MIIFPSCLERGDVEWMRMPRRRLGKVLWGRISSALPQIYWPWRNWWLPSLANPLRMITISIVEGGKKARKTEESPPSNLHSSDCEWKQYCVHSFLFSPPLRQKFRICECFFGFSAFFAAIEFVLLNDLDRFTLLWCFTFARHKSDRHKSFLLLRGRRGSST